MDLATCLTRWIKEACWNSTAKQGWEQHYIRFQCIQWQITVVAAFEWITQIEEHSLRDTIYPIRVHLWEFILTLGMVECFSNNTKMHYYLLEEGGLKLTAAEKHAQFPTYAAWILQGKAPTWNSCSRLWTYTFSISASLPHVTEWSSVDALFLSFICMNHFVWG